MTLEEIPPTSIEILKAKATLRELERRKREDKGEQYVPNFQGEGERCDRCGQQKSSQRLFHESSAKFRLIHAGDRAGKTEAAAMEFVWHCNGQHPLKKVSPPYKFRVCGDGMTDQVEQVLVEKYHELTPKRFLDGGSWGTAYSKSSHTLDITDGRGNTSRIGFVSYDQDPGKLAGKDLDGVHHDEPSPKSFWQENRSRLMDRDGFAIFTFTPRFDSLALWEFDIYERAKSGDSNYQVFNFHTLDNPYLSSTGIQSIIDDIGDDEDAYRQRLCGEFRHIGGLIYPNMKKEYHLREDAEVGFDREKATWPTGIAIDPGVSKEHAVGWFAVGPGSHIHFYKEYAMAGTIPDLCNDIRRLSGLDRLEYFFIDGHWDWDNRTAHSAFGPEALNIEREFQKCGLPVQKAPLDIRNWQGIDQVRARCKPQFRGIKDPMPLLTFSPECERMWYEMTHYSQVPPKKADPTRHSPKIRKIDDDFCDVVRIAVTSNPQYMSASSTKLYSNAMVDEYGIVF